MRKIISILALCPTLYFGQIVDMATGGQSISITETPYQVALFDYDGLSCGGSILNEKWVLTAAHCSRAPISKIKVGITNLNDTGQEVKIKKIIKHPNYNDYTNDNDIALIELAENIIFNQRVQPIRLVQTSDNLYNIGRSVSVSGWGWRYPNTGQPAQQLQKVDVPIISNSLANSQLDITYSLHPNLTSNMIATGAVNDNRKGTCHGDSGGPLVTNDDNGKLKQIGIVSWGVPKCLGGKNSPSIYTKVSNYLDWIYQYVPNPIAITGSPNVCADHHTTYTLTGHNGGDVEWILSSMIVKISSDNNSITVRAANDDYIPNPRLDSIIAKVNGVEVSKKIWASGKPRFEVSSYDYHSATVDSSIEGITLEQQGVTGGHDISWRSLTRHNTVHYGANHHSLISYREPDPLYISVSNSCGTEIGHIILQAPYYCKGDHWIGHISGDYYAAYEPCDNNGEYRPYTTNSILDTDKKSSLTIQISNATGQVVLTTQNKKFSLAHLLPGTYYARIIKNGKIVHTQTLLKR